VQDAVRPARQPYSGAGGAPGLVPAGVAPRPYEKHGSKPAGPHKGKPSGPKRG
jgi:hypothetical protein